MTGFKVSDLEEWRFLRRRSTGDVEGVCIDNLPSWPPRTEEEKEEHRRVLLGALGIVGTMLKRVNAVAVPIESIGVPQGSA